MNKLIMLVEDDENDAFLMSRVFKRSPKRADSDLVVLRDGAEALDYLFRRGLWAEQDAPFPAVVVLDLTLPKVNGLHVLEQIRANDRTRVLPVIVLSGSGRPEDVTRSYALGASSFIRKPTDALTFEAAADAIVTWMLINQNPV